MDVVQTAMILQILPVIHFVFSILFFAMIMYENKCPENTGRMTTGFYIFFMILTALHLAIFGFAMNKYLKDKNKPENKKKVTIGSLISIIITSLIQVKDQKKPATKKKSAGGFSLFGGKAKPKDVMIYIKKLF